MMIPSIDILDGQAVQLVCGKKKVLEAGDPRILAEKFAPVGEVAVIDLDAALGRGSNADLIREVVSIARCRVGGGIRDVESAIDWLDAGATQVILGTAAKPEILAELPRDRVIAALDATNGEVVVEGWQTKTGRQVGEMIDELREYVGGFLITFVEREGRMTGMPADTCRELVTRAAMTRITFAGGIRNADDIASLDQIGADAQVGMALYTDKISLADGFAAPLVSDREDGLWPTVVVDEMGTALGLAWSSRDSLRAAIDERVGVYQSRKRGLWRKGESSGATQKLLRVDADCDRDALRFTVRQQTPGFCHRETANCWGEAAGLTALQTRLNGRVANAPRGSYTRQLLDDPILLASKLKEEANELAEAETRSEVIHEAADIAYFATVAMARAGVSWADIGNELDRRALKLRRRGGAAKEAV